MFVRGLAQAPVRRRAGLRSHILLQEEDAEDVALAVTWVELAPGSAQRPHGHDAQQVYVVLRGRGRMRVRQEEREVGAGDLVFIPPGAVHGIESLGADELAYVSAATPAFDLAALYDRGPLEDPPTR